MNDINQLEEILVLDNKNTVRLKGTGSSSCGWKSALQNLKKYKIPDLDL